MVDFVDNFCAWNLSCQRNYEYNIQELERPKLRYQNIQRSDIQRAVLDYGRRNHQLTENELEELIEILHEIVVYSLDPVDDKICGCFDCRIKLYTKDGKVTVLSPAGDLLVENGVIIRCESGPTDRLAEFLGGLRDQYFSSPLW